MKAVKLSQIAKSPLTYIAVVVAIIAFATGLFISAQTPADITASGPKEVVIEVPVTYLNPDGAWPSPVPTPAPPSGQSDEEDDVLYYDDDVLHPDAHGVATMGKLLYLYDGGSIQLPTAVYVEEIWHGGAVCDDWPDCPEYPHYTLARGDDRAAIDRYGEPFDTWSISSESDPKAFEFLNK